MIGAPNFLNLNCKVRVMKEAPDSSVSEDIFRNYNIDNEYDNDNNNNDNNNNDNSGNNSDDSGKMDQTFESQQTPHTSPSRASYGVSIMRILEKVDRVITAPHCNNDNDNNNNDNNNNNNFDNINDNE